MYVPAGFDFEVAIELGKLICQAQLQLEAFEGAQKWKLEGDYKLLKEFHYSWKPAKAIEKGVRGFDLTLNRIRGAERKRVVRVPLGFAAQRKGNCYIVFRGTHTVKEWVRNLSLNLGPFVIPRHGNVHRGFLGTYTTMRDEIEQCMSGLDRRTDIFMGGHSLGAAIVTMALPDIESRMKRTICSAYTYGSPRVGDDAFARAYNSRFYSRSYRIVNTSDIVTSIPFPAPIMGRIGGYFSHVDTAIDMNVQLQDLEKNHSMKTYLEKLQENRGPRGLFRRLLGGSHDRRKGGNTHE